MRVGTLCQARHAASSAVWEQQARPTTGWGCKHHVIAYLGCRPASLALWYEPPSEVPLPYLELLVAAVARYGSIFASGTGIDVYPTKALCCISAG
jgi:hypothetical protein